MLIPCSFSRLEKTAEMRRRREETGKEKREVTGKIFFGLLSSFILHASSLLLRLGREFFTQVLRTTRMEHQLRSVIWTSALATILILCCAPGAWAHRLHLTNGAVIEADETWEDAQGIWYRQGGVTHLIARARVRAVERRDRRSNGESAEESPARARVERVAFVNDVATAGGPASPLPDEVTASNSAGASAAQSVWIYLAGGARVEAEEAIESADGVWYRRGGLSIFVARARVERIERGLPDANASGTVTAQAHRARGWSTGRARLDSLIRQAGARYGVDPYLIFCVMEQESQFNARAVSPVGAMGLMQLMPGTAARFGVRRPFEPAQNIAGGARYLRDLMRMFGGRVDLVLASYNAGEGAVRRYGHRVPPFRETRNYVRRVGARYGRTATPTAVAAASASTASAPRPQ